MKNCQVVCSYASDRRRDMYGSPTSVEECTNTIKEYVDNFNQINPGTKVDLIIINNDSNNLEHNEYISSLNGTLTNWGKIITITRPNIGGSFGAYATAVEKFFEDYDYWVFGEDDCFLISPNYYIDSINYLNSDTETSYIAYSPIAFWETSPSRVHCGGGFGFTSTKNIFSIINLNLSSYHTLPQLDGDFYAEAIRLETFWTAQFLSKGKTLKHLPERSPFAENNDKNFGLKRAKDLYLNNPEYSIWTIDPPIFKMR
jgi:hypothetical protein